MTKQKTVFLVDDDADDQDVFALALTEVDDTIACVTASDGIEALSKLRDDSVTPDCIFLDLNMPRMDGKQFLSELKKEAHLQHIPVIVYTTSADAKDVAETRALGAVDFLTKPPRINELTEALRLLLTKHKYADHDSFTRR